MGKSRSAFRSKRTQKAPTSSSKSGVDQLLRAALKSQYRAALTTLRRAVVRCPADLWTTGAPAFWHVAYHTAFYTHLYLQANEAAFRPWAHHRDEHQFLTSIPHPPYRPPRLGDPYTKTQVLEYIDTCIAMADPAVDALDLSAASSGFDWYPMPKLEHQLVNLRHIQHHAALLSARLRAATGKGVSWIGSCAVGRDED